LLFNHPIVVQTPLLLRIYTEMILNLHPIIFELSLAKFLYAWW